MTYSIDRIEGNIAVLEDADGNTRDIDRALLPADAAEGMMVRETDGGFELDEGAAAARRARVIALQNRLRGNRS